MNELKPFYIPQNNPLKRYRAHAIDGDDIQTVPHVTWMYLCADADEALKRKDDLLRRCRKAFRALGADKTAPLLAAIDAEIGKAG